MLRCICPLLAQSGGSQGIEFTSAFGRAAEVHGRRGQQARQMVARPLRGATPAGAEAAPASTACPSPSRATWDGQEGRWPQEPPAGRGLRGPGLSVITPGRLGLRAARATWPQPGVDPACHRNRAWGTLRRPMTRAAASRLARHLTALGYRVRVRRHRVPGRGLVFYAVERLGR